MDAAFRLLASQIRAKETSEWWDNLPAEQKKEYIGEHPNSKYANQAIHEKEAAKGDQQADPGPDGRDQPEGPKSLQPGSPQRKAVATTIKKGAPKIAKLLKHAFPRISAATEALHHLGTGKPLEHEHKEVLHEFGGIALKTALGHVVGAEAAKLLGNIGVTAIHYGIEKFKEHKDKDPHKDDVETFVESVADGIENAEAAPVPAEHAAPKSHYRTAIAKHLKKNAIHVVAVLDRSFKDIKPATQGLVALAHGKPLDEHHKKAVKNLGKVALGVSIASLPGGLAAHIAAGVGTAALNYAYRHLKKELKPGETMLHHFVEAIGEGLEDALIENGGEGHGKEG